MSLSTLSELQAQFEALTTRIAALDRDIALESDGERRSLAREKRAELARERETIAGEMEMMQQGERPRSDQHAPLDHRVSTLERDVRRLWGIIKPSPRQQTAKLIFWGLLVLLWSMWMIKEIRDWLMAYPFQAVAITLALIVAALIIRWLPEDEHHD
jgi:hypothetical protein